MSKVDDLFLLGIGRAVVIATQDQGHDCKKQNDYCATTVERVCCSRLQHIRGEGTLGFMEVRQI